MKYTAYHADQFHRDVEKEMNSLQKILEKYPMPTFLMKWMTLMTKNMLFLNS